MWKVHRRPVLAKFVLFLVILLCPCMKASENFDQTRSSSSNSIHIENEADKYLTELEGPYSAACNRLAVAEWNYLTNVTKAGEEATAAARTNLVKFEAEMHRNTVNKFPNWREFRNESLRRELKHILYLGNEESRDMTMDDIANLSKLLTDLSTDYGTAAVCEFDNPSNCSLRLEPELDLILRTETDPTLLSYYWAAWHDKMSEKVPPEKYQQYLTFQKGMAQRNGFKDMWMFPYDDDSPDFNPEESIKQMLEIWEGIRPMYETLHAYVRMKLKKNPKYKGLFGKCGYIPIYLTGNMWGQDWNNLYLATNPYPKAPSMDATEAMRKQNYTAMKMFKVTEKFFTDLGLPPMTSTFWEKSMLERPQDGRQVVCHGSAHDSHLGRGNEDFRIKQCTAVDMRQLLTAHHEMGHIAYFQQYANQRITFRSGANPGFHEAVGDALALSARTPQHLQCKVGLELGLDPSICQNGTRATSGSDQACGADPITETDLNYLYLTALSKLAFLPFVLSVFAWRREAFEGKLHPDEFNKRWWELRMKNQGLEPSSRDRLNNPKMFDPAAKYHIVASIEYLRYFVSNILQFQFYEAMCIVAGQYSPNDTNGDARPLYQCDFSGSKKAGKLLKDMMSMGSSKGWPVALEAMTGSRSMSIVPLKEYFQPILDHIGKELKENGEVPGFGSGWGACKDD